MIKNKRVLENSSITNEALQVILTGVVGDGCLYRKKESWNSYYTTSCIHKEYIEYKKFLLGTMAHNVTTTLNHGYKKGELFHVCTIHHPEITKVHTDSLENNLKKLDRLGVAMWFYDDGTIHKNNHCYHLCTHAFTRAEHEDVIIPFLNNFLDVKVKLAQETKHDGRHFYYCRINTGAGAPNVSKLLSQFPLECYSYKLIENQLLFEKIGDEIYFSPKGLTYGRILDMGGNNWNIVFEDDGVKTPEHTLSAAKAYVRKHYKDHSPV